jgi:hypothetical protein
METKLNRAPTPINAKVLLKEIVDTYQRTRFERFCSLAVVAEKAESS